MKYRFKHIFQYVVVRILISFFLLLPYRVILFIAWLGAGIAFYIFRFRVDKVKERINKVYPNRYTKKEVRGIAWISWRNIIFNSVEMPLGYRMNYPWIVKFCACQEVMAVLKKHADTGKGAIIACPHMGNWELAAIACHVHKIPIFSIAAVQKNSLINDYMNYLRRAPGIDTVSRGQGAIKDVIRSLKNGKMLAILPDVRVAKPDLKIDFLSGQANLGSGMASFAKQLDIPIFPCIVKRVGWYKHKIYSYPAIYPDSKLSKTQDILRMTQQVMKIIDENIAKEPSQWFWFNKRWVLEPVAEK